MPKPRLESEMARVPLTRRAFVKRHKVFTPLPVFRRWPSRAFALWWLWFELVVLREPDT